MATGPVPIAESRILRAFAESVDGNEYVDYLGGHGALILGHNHPDFHLYRGNETPEEIYGGKAPWKSLKGGIQPELVNKIRAGFLLHGIDIAAWPGGLTSAAHTEDDVARTVAAFESTFDLLAAEGAL